MTTGAAEAETLAKHSAAVCWTCERPADGDATLWATLESVGPARDPLGYEITVEAAKTIVTIPVPRCRVCRSWFGWRQGIIVLSVFAGVFTPGVVLVLYSHLAGVALPSDIFDGFAHLGSLLLFFACIGASLVMWWYVGLTFISLLLGHRPLRGRNENNFPPIAALRAIGWKWPTSTAD